LTEPALSIVILGLTITSSWGNGHATTYRALVRELSRRGHRVTFLERDVPWYASNRDMATLPWGQVRLYRGLEQLEGELADTLRQADVVLVGSYVPDGVEVGRRVLELATGTTAFYDIDTPVTLAALRRGECTYLTAELVPRYDLYLSFTGGPVLQELERTWGAPLARALYCSCDPEQHRPVEEPVRWDLGYLGTYSADRQPALERLMLEAARAWPAGRFVVAGPQYPESLAWPRNVERVQHLAPPEHPGFYGAQRFTLNITRADMVRVGYSPSVRLFEAAACGVPIISDVWPGLESIFEPGRELLLSRSAEETLRYVRELPEAERQALSQRARARVLAEHTAAHRAESLEGYFRLARERAARRRYRFG
jgi:spore maturation protein CgeB